MFSPILFCLFIADFKEFLEKEGNRGVLVNHLTDILILAYADDSALLSDSASGMKKILKALYKYCSLNDLEINANKIKIVICRKGGHAHDKKYGSFAYGDDGSIENVPSYTYLGVPFSNSTVVLSAADSAILNRMRMDSWLPIKNC